MTKEITEIKSFDIVLTEFNTEFAKELKEFKDKYTNVVYDLEDSSVEKQARADRLAIGKVVSRLDKAHRVIKIPMEAESKRLDLARKTIKDDLLKIQDSIKDQLKSHDEKIVRHCAMLQKKIDDITLFTDISDDTAFTLGDRLKQVKRVVIDESFENREADAHMAKTKVIEALEGKLALQEKFIKEEKEAAAKAESDRLAEQVIRDQKIRDEMAAKAKEDSEIIANKVEQDKIDLANKAKLAIQAATDKAIKDAADKQKIIDDKIKSDKDKADYEAKKLKEKMDDKEHQAKINNESLKSLVNVVGLHEDDAKLLIKAIILGRIKNVCIKY